ncbi:MAG: acyl-CoA dehydrogenase family protein [Gammaproteobacteria bacterium]
MNAPARRDAAGLGLALLSRFASLRLVDQLHLRKPAERLLTRFTRAGFRTAAAASRSFKAVQTQLQPQRLRRAAGSDLFDLQPTEEQQMLREAVQGFAQGELRPAAAAANEAGAAPPELLQAAAELGIGLMGIPEALGGAGQERSVLTHVLVTEALAHGDMGLAVACLAPSAVSNALVLWGDEVQQATYLSAFLTDNAPVAALALNEPGLAFNPLQPQTLARRSAGGYELSGTKCLVPRAAQAELLVVSAQVEGEGPALFIVESASQGLDVEPEPAMGLRAAATARVRLNRVRVPAANRLGQGADTLAECLRLSRLGWCALAVGTAQSVMDFVIPYVNERVAFGEPISHRQSVAFAVANIGIELEGMRLATWRAASLAEQDKPCAREVALAHRLCVDKGMQIGSDGVQLLGGHGFTKEYPVERWYRDLRAVGVMHGAVLM